MGIGKYSPTVTHSYTKDRDWWRNVSQDGCVDPDGFDRYGYSNQGEGVDRAGYTELDYLNNYCEESGRYDLYERVKKKWECKEVAVTNPD